MEYLTTLDNCLADAISNFEVTDHWVDKPGMGELEYPPIHLDYPEPELVPDVIVQSNKFEDKERLISFMIRISDLYKLYGPGGGGAHAPVGDYGLHREVGDDHIAYTSSVVQFLAELDFSHRYFGVEISEKDTFVSKNYGNYSESWILLPQNLSERWVASEVSGKGAIPFLDIVKLRTLLPVSSMKQKHSDTLEGKVSLVSKNALFSSTILRRDNNLSLVIQCTSLNLKREPKFPFLPNYLGGLGMPVFNSNIRQFIRMVNQYKSGRYHSLIYTIAESVSELSKGRIEELQFLSRITDVTQHWRTWYTFYSRYVPSISGQIPDFLEEPYRVGTLGKDPIWDLAADRLKNLKGLVSETEVLVHLRNSELTRALLSSQTINEYKECLQEERSHQKMVTIFSNSFKTMWNTYIYREINDDPTEDEVNLLLSLITGGDRTLRLSLRSDRLYLPEIMDNIYDKHPLKVDLGVIVDGHSYPIYLDPTLLPDQIVHRDELLDWVTNPKGYPPRYLLDDDPILLLEVEEFMLEMSKYPTRVPVVFIRTTDFRLCSFINEQTSLPIVALNPKASEDEIAAYLWEKELEFPIMYIKYLIDTGSVIAHNAIKIGEGSHSVIRETFKCLHPRRLIKQRDKFSGLHLATFDKFARYPSGKPRRRYQKYNPFRLIRKRRTDNILSDS